MWSNVRMQLALEPSVVQKISVPDSEVIPWTAQPVTSGQKSNI